MLITSMSVYANIENTDILIFTSAEFYPIVHKELSEFAFHFHYCILDLRTLMEAGCSRLHIFEYEHIQKYEKILYLDVDILINGDLNKMLQIPLHSEKLYAFQEGFIGHHFWGAQFFDFTKHNTYLPAFTSCVLFFVNSDAIKDLFQTIRNHIEQYISEKKPVPICLDQPFIVYNAISQNKYNNNDINQFIETNPKNPTNSKLIYHFCGNPGAYQSKQSKMNEFWRKMEKKRTGTITHPHTTSTPLETPPLPQV